MEGGPRYEIVDTIASGDFAVVYRARDRELGREVAVKQIHQQYLTDQRQLARYWQEAQLLASLQHPNILTIYDIVRSKGWLILELMRGSLQPATQSEGIDLDYLRVAMAGCLSALQFLHSNGVIHGDIKPSNLLVDAQGRVKLGDFGLARRASNEGGSLLKGATKYMAPEMLSAQFGPVGPASDLYSLGFSAYELMCGAQFETLFPGLGSFGRDKQIAWMMWHAAADRAMPPINRVLEGVPDDLARVIQRLVIKDQAHRYQSAKEVLRDLQSPPLASIPHEPEADEAAEAAKAAAAKQKRRMRYAAVAALTFSVILSAVMLWLMRPPAKPPGPPEPDRGVVRNLYPDEAPPRLEIVRDGKAKEIEVNRYARIFINDEPEQHLLRDLLPHDQVIVKEMMESGHKVKEIRAFRPEIAQGQIKEIKADDGQFTLAVDLGGGKSKELVIAVPQELKISFNGQTTLDGHPVTLADLRPDDRVVVHHRGKEFGREATELVVQRVVTVDGKIGEVKNAGPKNEPTLTINIGTDEKSQLIELPFAPDCEITVNGRRLVNDHVLKPADLKPGDKATVAHDTRVVKVTAERIIQDAGTIGNVQAQSLDVIRQGASTPTHYSVGPTCTVTLDGAPAKLSELHRGDNVEITHRAVDGKNPEATAVAARRAADWTRWAILIGIQNYDDRLLSRLEYAAADAKLLRDALVARYQVPDDQASLLTDEDLARLQQGIPDRLSRVGADGTLLVFFAGHAYKDEDGKIYLAPKNFDLKHIGVTGLPLQWLVDELEKCQAKEKLLLLDCSHAGSGADAAKEPSTAEMLRSLKAPPGRGPLRTITAIASCRRGQRGADWPEKKHGLFVWLLAQGYAGAADKNRDNRIEPTELFGYIQDEMAAAVGPLKVAQTPELFLPDNRPPRLSEETKTAIRKLAAEIRQPRINPQEAEADYNAAAAAAGKESDPKLLYAVLLLKDRQRDAALKQFEEIKSQHPDLLLPLEGIAWVRFEKRAYQSGVEELTELISKAPPPKNPGDPYPEPVQQIFTWAGQLREYAALAVEDSRRPSANSLSALDAAVARQNADGQRCYAEGRAKSHAVYKDFEQQIAGANSPQDALKLKYQSRELTRYVEFPYGPYLQQVLDGLDQ